MLSGLTRRSVIELAENAEAPCVSIYMPTHRSGEETRQDPVRFKNLLRVAEDQLLQSGVRPRDIERLLEPARKLLADTPFWWHLNDGLGAFLSPAGLSTWRLPWRFDEHVMVGQRFHVKPLIQLLAYNGEFYVLALSLNRVRLLEASMFGVAEVELEEAPRSLAQALGERDVERVLQARTSAPGGSGGSATTFHGHGEDTAREKKEIEGFLRQVDQGIVELVGDSKALLVLAGVEYVTTLYRHINSYPHLLMEDTVPGSPEDLSAEDLRRRAWDLVRPRFEQAEQRALEQYGAAAGTGKTTFTVEGTVRAAREGRVAVLLAAHGVEAWGRQDADQHAITLTEVRDPGSEDLVERASYDTLRGGGDVFVLSPNRMPARSTLAALLRY